MSSPYTIVAFLYPRPEKFDRAMEVAGELIAHVKDNEPDTIVYEWYKSVDEAGAPRLTIFEHYKNKEAFDLHGASSAFAEAFRKLEGEDLVAAAPKLDVLEKVAGFRR